MPSRSCCYAVFSVNELPSHYRLPRWAKKSNGDPSGSWVDLPSVPSGFNVGKLWTIFTRCVTKATGSDDAFSFATERLERYESDLNEYVSTSSSLGCGNFIYWECKVSDTIVIHPSKLSKTKGSGRRIKGEKELAIERQEKRPRLCGACGSDAYHDSRNC